MEYNKYVRSAQPLWFSGIALGALLLVPLWILLSEGGHSGVVWAVVFAFWGAVFVPGIYLLRPLVFWIWQACVVISGIAGSLVLSYYWNSAPEWMDAGVPGPVTVAIKAGIWLAYGSSLILGSMGWATYLRRRSQTAAEPPAGL